jgi:signal transduction histidine kinase
MPLYATPYLILPLLSTVVNAGVAVYSWQHRKRQPVALPLFWLMVGMAGWSLVYALNTAATSLSLKVFFFKAGVSCCCLIGPAILAMALESTGRGQWLTRRRLTMICALPVASCLMAWTNDLHLLVRSDLHLRQSGPLLVLGFKDGPFFLIHFLYIVLANCIAVSLLVSAFWNSPRRERPRFMLLIIATIVPLSVQIMQPTPVKGFDMTTSSLFLSGILYIVALFRHRLLDVVPLARAALFAQIGEPVLVFDAKGALMDCNQSTRRLAGGGRKQPMDLVLQTLLTRFPELKEALVPPGQVRRAISFSNSAKEGRCWRISTSPVQSAGILRGRLVLLHDISDLKQIENKLTESEKQLLELNSSLLARVEEETRRRVEQERLLANHARLAAMGEMIGAIAHQWRQPLATLGMIVQRTHAMGNMHGLTPDYLNEFKANAMRQVRYMSDTIEEFRGFYRLEKQKELFSPYNCIAAAIRLFEPQFVSGGIVVEVTCQNCIEQTIYGFPNEFKQVVLNLLANARDAIQASRTNGGGPAAGRIGVSISLAGDDLIHIDVSDNGCGVPAEIASLIFDPYFTTKEKSGGTGIGLHLSRLIVEDSLGGRLNMLNNQNGAIFRVELPLGAQP